MNTHEINEFKSMTNEKFTPMEKEILEKNRKFFSADIKYVNTMLEILKGESEISLRVLEWFISNYSKKNNTIYKIRINGKKGIFNVYNEYKNQLNSYNKKYFDPFCRKGSKKIIWRYRNKTENRRINFITSIGQLNFFQWAIRYKIVKYVHLHLGDIEADMKKANKENKERKKLSKLKLSTQSISSTKSEVSNDSVDPIICSSDKINSLIINSVEKKSLASQTDSDGKNKRQPLSKSVYDYGIKKMNIPIKLDFE